MSTYIDFPTTNAFLIPTSQKKMFLSIKDNHPDVYTAILEGVKSKGTKRNTIVTIYGDYNDGRCPKQIKTCEDFETFQNFDVRLHVAPQVHNGGWITESISVIAHR